MDTKTIDIIKDLSDDAFAQRLSNAQWAGMLKQSVSPQTWQELLAIKKVGILRLRDPEVRELAKGAYPYMANHTIELEDGSTREITPWLEKIQSQGITRPNDLIHLSRIVELTENDAAAEFFAD